MTVTMKFTGRCSQDQQDPADVLVFGSDAFPNVPLYSDRVSTSRKEGVAVKLHNAALTGFVRGANHYEVRSMLQALHTFSFYNHLHLLYAVDEIIIANAQVYIDAVAEPQDWKEYSARYTISFHYFTCPCDDNPVGSPVTAVLQDGSTYTFKPQPTFSINNDDVKQGPHACQNTMYSNERLGRKITKNFTGVLCASTHSELKAKMDELDGAIKDNFLLTYGDWSEWVFVESLPSYQLSDFTTHAIYQFSVSYHDKEIIEMESKVSFTRQHHYTKVTPRLYCGRTEVDSFHESGQYITYSLTLLSVDRVKTRIQLNQEFSMMIVGGGTLMEGGTEEWNGDGSMSVTGMFYYDTPILPLVESSGAIPADLEQYKCEKSEPVPI